jgi:hypothetical protein
VDFTINFILDFAISNSKFGFLFLAFEKFEDSISIENSEISKRCTKIRDLLMQYRLDVQ